MIKMGLQVRLIVVAATVTLICVGRTNGWLMSTTIHKTNSIQQQQQLQDPKIQIPQEGSNRRILIQKSFTILGSVFLSTNTVYPVLAANAKTTTTSNIPTTQELEKLQLGHARVKYLIDHWDDVTKICGTAIMSDTERKQVVRTEGGGGTDACSKNPLRVQEFMGYKSTTDPLYRADKLMVRASPLVDPDDFEEYFDVVERYREKADGTALLAYTSSWGEANPNGGKEVIDDYLEQTKAQVLESEALLRSVLNFLKLKTLPPIEGKV